MGKISLEKRLLYRFRDKKLLKRALTHSSCKIHTNESNETLEFLGDAIFNMVVVEYLYMKYPGEDEGRLSYLKSMLVSAKTLLYIASELELSKYVYVGGGIKKLKVVPDSILADCVEALIAAIYIDSGKLEEVKRLVLSYIEPLVRQNSFKDLDMVSFKNELQELIQARFNETPKYKVLSESGPDHLKEFECGVYINGNIYGKGRGRSKKEAEQNAAKEALKKIGQIKKRRE